MSVGQITSPSSLSGLTPKIKIATNLPAAARFTFMCWAMHTGGTPDAYSDIIAISDDNDVIGMTFHTVGSAKRFSMGDLGSDVDGSLDLPDNEWHHCALTVDDVTGSGTRAIGYLDGIQHLTGSLVNPPVPTFVQVFNSRSSDSDGGGVWIGYLAAVKIWTDVALTPAEIRREMWTYTPQRWTNLWAWTPLEDSNFRTHNYGGLAGTDWTTQSTFFVDGPNPPGVLWDDPLRVRDVAMYTPIAPMAPLMARPVTVRQAVARASYY